MEMKLYILRNIYSSFCYIISYVASSIIYGMILILI